MQAYKPSSSIAVMDEAGVSTAFLSCCTPGLWLGDDFAVERDEAIALARDMNDYASRMRSDYKGRFGLFAVLPLPDIDASLREIEYALDTLKADGVGLLTSYGDIWLGDKRLEPVMDELNRRNAVVYVHPTDPACCHSLVGGPMGVGKLEWFTDTARTIFSLVSRRLDAPADAPNELAIPAARYSNIRFVWSHGGGTLIAAPRIAALDSALGHIRRFYYDTASATPIVMQGLKQLLGGTSHIVFGSDYPYYTPVSVTEALRTVGFSEAELRGIERENGLGLVSARRA